MAGRVSRRQQISDRNNNIVTAKATQKHTYKAGMYKRLSLLDSRQKRPSESLNNQELLIRDYLLEHPEIELVDVYTDNGETGTDFERSDFVRLMDDVKARKINCIIVKDLSRFGRSYLEAEEYIEKIFPFLGIRFIAVLDNIDTFSPECRVDDIMRSMKNLMNEAYSRDLSHKIGTAFDTKRAKGEMLYRVIPYGYEKSGNPMHPYKIDENSANVVRRIFQMYADGYNTSKIVSFLNETKVPTPRQYHISKGLTRPPKEHDYWNTVMISNMLRNIVYIGAMEQEKARRSFCENLPMTLYPKEEWKVYKNVNEPIISEELFYKVQELMPKHKKAKTEDCPERHKVSIVENLFYCKVCGKPLSRRWEYRGKYYIYICKTHAVYGNMACTNKRSITEKDVESVVKAQVREQIMLLANALRTFTPYGASEQPKELTDLDEQIAKTELELKRKKATLIPLFEDFCKGKFSEYQYMYKKEQAEIFIAEKTLELSETVKARKKLAKKQPTKDFVSKILKFDAQDEIGKELIAALVERIEYDSDKSITVILKYHDIFEDLISRMEKAEEKIWSA